MNLWETVAWFALNMAVLVAGGVAVIPYSQQSKTRWWECAIWACVATALQAAAVPAVVVAAVLTVGLAILYWQNIGKDFRLTLFMAFYWITAVYVADFESSSILRLLLQDAAYTSESAPQSLVGPCIARCLLCLFAFAVVWHSKRHSTHDGLQGFGFIPACTMLLAVPLSAEQQTAPLKESADLCIFMSALLIICVTVYRLRSQRDRGWKALQSAQQQASAVERDYELLKSTYEANAKLYHDLHNHIEVIHYSLQQKDIDAATKYCEDLLHSAANTAKAARYTGDNVTDFLISSKLELATSQGIAVAVDVECPANMPIRSMDFTTILGNLLDNAIEAAITAPAGERILRLVIKPAHQMLLIKVENTSGQAPKKERGRWKTSKTQSTNQHGWGLRNVLDAAERYNGGVDTFYEDGLFAATILLSLQPDIHQAPKTDTAT